MATDPCRRPIAQQGTPKFAGRNRLVLWLLLMAAALWLTACGRPPAESPTDVPSRPTAHPARDEIVPANKVYAYTHQRLDGNRFVDGSGGLAAPKFIDVKLSGQPLWLVAVVTDFASVWAVALEDGHVQAFGIAGDAVAGGPASLGYLPQQAPLVLTSRGGLVTLLSPPPDNASAITHPVPVGDSGKLAYIDSGGDLVFWDNREIGRLKLNALPDARILVDERERLLLLTKPSARYDHGVVGDGLEATEITLVQTQPEAGVMSRISIPAPAVVEGISPIWTDLDGDGVREIIVTVSDGEQGARLVAYNEAGRLAATGPAVGRGGRWRHQIAAAPFGPNGGIELAAVQTPHIGGVAEFYRMEGAGLKVVARLPGVTSHVIGSRNLDMGVAGDFDGDGQVELVVLTQDLTGLAGVRRTKGGAEVAWTAPIGGRAATNLAAVTTDSGTLMLGVAREDGVLRVWLGQ